MVTLTDDGYILSPSDLTSAAACEFGWLRRLDELLGRIESIETSPDAMLEQTAVLGDRHEQRALETYRHEGLTIVEIERPMPYTPEMLLAAQAATVAALENQTHMRR